MCIKITGHPSLASDLQKCMSQLTQGIDMLSQSIKASFQKYFD